MKSIFIDCVLGISGDMLASALLDLGVPKYIFLDNLEKLNIEKNHKLEFRDSESEGIKGIVLIKNSIEDNKFSRSFNEVKNLLLESSLNDYVKEKSINVFEILAKAESVVHGKEITDVHFHEIGSIDSIVDIVNVCSAIDFLKPGNIYFSNPPAGKGVILTSHGILPIPVPTVLEIAKQNKIALMSIDDEYFGEITTPTGIALTAAFVDKFGQPNNINIKKIGIGLGIKNISRPNFLRVLLLDSDDENKENKNQPVPETIICQESWIDDSTPEDIAVLIERLRAAGAIDVVSYSVDMKKNRKGICIKAIVSQEHKDSLMNVWLNFSTTIGIRENKIGRWILPRKTVTRKTKFGDVNVKQIIRPNGKISIKVDHQDLTKITLDTGIPIEEIRQRLYTELSEFYELDNWLF